MPEFDKLQWADSQFSNNFRDEADIYLPFRETKGVRKIINSHPRLL